MYDFKGNQKESHSGNGFFGELVNAALKSQQLCFEKRMCAIGHRPLHTRYHAW